MGVRLDYVLVIVLAVGVRSRVIDDCQDDNHLVGQIGGTPFSCPFVVSGLSGMPGCDLLGFACPVSCGLCPAAKPANCTTFEIAENKRPLANVVRSLGLCPDCKVPDVVQPMVWRLKNKSVYLDMASGGYTTDDSSDPCSVAGVYCDRCGVSKSIVAGTTIKTLMESREGVARLIGAIADENRMISITAATALVSELGILEDAERTRLVELGGEQLPTVLLSLGRGQFRNGQRRRAESVRRYLHPETVCIPRSLRINIPLSQPACLNCFGSSTSDEENSLTIVAY